MKRTLLLLSFFMLLLSGCAERRNIKELLSRADSLKEANPDSAFILLETTTYPIDLHNDYFAHWCMLDAEMRDKLNKKMPDADDLEKAVKYYTEHGTLHEQSRILLYRGRTQYEDKEYEDAIETYLLALDKANEDKDYNQAGYICTYMADIYVFKDQYENARKKYEEATMYFGKGNNLRSKAIALYNTGAMYTCDKLAEKSFPYYEQSESIVKDLQDSAVVSALYNRIAISYSELKEYDKAEKYYLLSIENNNTKDGSNFLALSELYTKQGDLSKARLLLQQANFDLEIADAIIYQHYLIEKKKGDFKLALDYHEQYLAIADSTALLHENENVFEVEKRYEKTKVVNENSHLRIAKQINFIFLIISILIGLVLFVIYLLAMKRKDKLNRKLILSQNELLNKGLILQEKELLLQKNEKELSEKKAQLSNEKEKRVEQEIDIINQEQILNERGEEIRALKDEVINIQKQKLKASALGKRIIKLSQCVKANQQTPLLTDKDWQLLQKEVNLAIPNYTDKLRAKATDLNEEDILFCNLSLFDIETKGLAILLNINAESVSKRRIRIKERAKLKNMGVTFETFITNL